MAVERSVARERRLARINELLSTSGDTPSEPNTAVGPGCIVSLLYAGDESPEPFYVGEPDERPGEMAVITPASPLGSALLGSVPGDEVRYAAPAGILSVRVVAIS